MKPLAYVALAVIFGALSGGLAAWVVVENNFSSKNSLIENFYLVENEVHVSPHSLRAKMDKGIDDFVLVDLRSQEEYEKGHIIGAVNIPAYKDKSTPAYEEKERIVRQFRVLPKGKDIIVYCYSTQCMTGRKIGKMLAENGVYVKHLGIGWNEWRYFWTMWNHEYEWNTTKAEDYVWEGREPGIPKASTGLAACQPEDGFGC